jgi:uncharacterized short protein YbdD (DUF466 family)
VDELTQSLRRLWRAFRELSGDDAYGRYLAHWRAQHGLERPLSEGEFYRAALEHKWSRINRCC